MKKIFTFFTVLVLQASALIYSQPTETWNYEGVSIGVDATGPAITDECFMPEVIRIGTEYYMYYTGRYSGRSAIYYATSPDMISWTVVDTIMTGFADPLNREFHIGGSSVIKTSTGQYRMFYRCCESYTVGPPAYHIRSAISSDGITFVKEGIRIEIQPYLSNSYFTLAGQSAFYLDAGGNPKVIITGLDTTMSTGTPARLYTAQSADDGLTWTNFTPLYDNAHDAVVIKDSSGTYHLYCSYLLQGHRKSESVDGVGWPMTCDSILIKDSNGSLTEESSPDMIADLGAAVDATGEIILFSNFKPVAPGPWLNVAYYFLESAAAVNETSANPDFVIYPNPTNDLIYFNASNGKPLVVNIYNATGEIVFMQSIIATESISLRHLENGLYLYQVFSDGENVATGKFIKN